MTEPSVETPPADPAPAKQDRGLVSQLLNLLSAAVAL
jgi:hypothetical protein